MNGFEKSQKERRGSGQVELIKKQKYYEWRATRDKKEENSKVQSVRAISRDLI